MDTFLLCCALFHAAGFVHLWTTHVQSNSPDLNAAACQSNAFSPRGQSAGSAVQACLGMLHCHVLHRTCYVCCMAMLCVLHDTCMAHTTCCMAHATCCMEHATCCKLHMLRVAWNMLCVASCTCYVLQVACAVQCGAVPKACAAQRSTALLNATECAE